MSRSRITADSQDLSTVTIATFSMRLRQGACTSLTLSSINNVQHIPRQSMTESFTNRPSSGPTKVPSLLVIYCNNKRQV